jgi:hypothetical protein
MARTAGKKSGKGLNAATTTPTSKTSSTTTISTTAKTASGPPAPFILVPPALQPLTSTLPTNHVYLVHLDRTPVDLKWRVFKVPVLLNLFIVFGLCVRVYYAAPAYLEQIITIFGFDTSYSVRTSTESTGDLISMVSARFFLVFIDYALFALIGSWPREFIFGSKVSRFVGPWGWRRKVWFEETEIIVRRGRFWDTPLVETDDKSTKTWTTQEELTIKFKLEPAIQPSYVAKSGLLLLDKDWDLDFKAMLDAHRMVKDGRLKLEDLDGVALVYYQKQWLSWKVREEIVVPVTNPEAERVLQNFREKLTGLGQEDVFFRWIEIVQYETSLLGGFTEARQVSAVKELTELLTNRGVDCESFWTDIGGHKGLPGL